MEQHSLRFPNELWEKLKKIADEEELPVSILVRKIIKEYLDIQQYDKAFLRTTESEKNEID